MNNLYAPWRSDYSDDVSAGKQNAALKDACVFCRIVADSNDEEHFVIKRFEYVFVMLNRFPYNAGHLLIIPYAHKGSLQEISVDTYQELMGVTVLCEDVLKKALNPDGFNIGMNLGKAAGAGIPSHLHMHVLPRWQGDTNFMPALGQTKVISYDLTTVYHKIKAVFGN